jgi:Ca2+-binding RTX toxin-like protein
VTIAGGVLASVAGGTLAGVEAVTANLGDGIDTLTYAGSTEAVTVDLGAGTASGFASVAAIENVVGGSGNDLLVGAAGVTNTLTGGAGDDTFVVHDSADVVVEAGLGGTDEVRSLANTYTITNAAVENLTFIGNGNFSGTGNAAANLIAGGSGDDVLSGLAGNDLLNGGAGNDALSGGLGNDVLAGGAGDDSVSGGDGSDVLNGNAGNDVLNGGLGLDLFVFQAGFGQDRVEDFDASAVGGQDRMDISALGVTAASFGASVAIAVADVDGAGLLDTVVTIGGDSVTLLGVNGVGDNAITQADFILA